MTKRNYLRIVLLILLLIVISIAIYKIESTRVKPGIFDKETITVETNSASKSTKMDIEAKTKLYPRSPELTGIVGYLNTDLITITNALEDNKVVLIDFWTYTCINCIRTLPYLKDWDDKYRDQGLQIIGVHTPEFEFEKIKENVQMAIDKYDIQYPVVQDNHYLTWNAFKNRYWPRKYLIDTDGFIRYDHIGEGGYEETEKKIQELLQERGTKIYIKTSNIEDKTPSLPQSPELYAGYNFALPRGQNIGNPEGLIPDQEISYQLPKKIKQNTIYLEGNWKSTRDNLIANSDGSIVLNFIGTAANIVGESINASFMEVLINDNPISEGQAGDDVKIESAIGIVLIDQPRLFNLYRGSYTNSKLTLKVRKGFSFNAFTFG